jgi:hypothetical protein
VFENQNRLADELLTEQGIIQVFKVPRSGATISLILRSFESRKKVAIFAHTQRILKQISREIPRLTNRIPTIGIFKSNQELCLKVPRLPIKFQFKEDCQLCQFNKSNHCPFQRLLINDYDIYGLTYAKLRALQLSRTRSTNAFLAKLRRCEVFIFDEITTAIVGTISTFSLVSTNSQGEVKRVSDQIAKLKRQSAHLANNIDEAIKTDFWAFIECFLQLEQITENGEHANPCWNPDSDRQRHLFIEGWRYIIELTRKLQTDDLQELFLIALISSKLEVNYDENNLSITPIVEDALAYLHAFITKISDKKIVFLVDSYQPRIQFKHLFSRMIQQVTWGKFGDPVNTNSQQLIVCDTAHWGEYNFRRDENLRQHLKEFLQEFTKHFPPHKILIVTTNRRMADTVKEWDLPDDIRVTYHRSTWMRGVPVENRRIMICLGGPYLPKNAYMSPSKSFDIKLFSDNNTDEPRIAQWLRIDDTRSEFINAIARVKDPTSQERCIVLTFGMKYGDVKALFRQPNSSHQLSQPICIYPIRRGGLRRDGFWIAHLWLNQEVSSKHLPIIARIIRVVHEKNTVRASEILPHNTSQVLLVANQYQSILRKYNVSIVEVQGGTRFCLKN